MFFFQSQFIKKKHTKLTQKQNHFTINHTKITMPDLKTIINN